MKSNFSPKRMSKEFDEIIKKIDRKRISKGVDKKFRGSRRITLAFARHPKINDIAEDIINADLRE